MGKMDKTKATDLKINQRLFDAFIISSVLHCPQTAVRDPRNDK
jgi:hypothetical protein